MKVISGPRGSGRTSRLIEYAAGKKVYIACHSRHEALRIADVASGMNLEILHPITYDEMERMVGTRTQKVAIDNIEMFAQFMLRHLSVVAIVVEAQDE